MENTEIQAWKSRVCPTTGIPGSFFVPCKVLGSQQQALGNAGPDKKGKSPFLLWVSEQRVNPRQLLGDGKGWQRSPLVSQEAGGATWEAEPGLRMLCQSLHRVNRFSFLPHHPERQPRKKGRKKRKGRGKGRKEGFWRRLPAWAEGSGSRTGRGQTLLLCLPENKGAGDYTRIRSLFTERSNPLRFPCLAFEMAKGSG